MRDLEEIAKTIYWACYEMYPPHPHNFTKDRAWKETSDEHRNLCRFQAKQVITKHMGLIK